ncbi:MAG: ATP-grasp domain-containing protein [Devosia sp.]
MLIGITYDLVDDYLAAGATPEQAAAFTTPGTIDALEAAFALYGHDVERIGNLLALGKALADGKRWDLVFNLSAGAAGIAREAQVPALLEAHGIPFTFSTADVLVVSLDKALAKLVVKAAGVPTPDFAVVRNMRDLQRLNMPFPLFVKPLAESGGKGVTAASRVTDKATLANRCIDVLKLWHQPALVEAYLPGREFTVGIVGTGPSAHAIGTCEIKFGGEEDRQVYSFRTRTEGQATLSPVHGDMAAAIEDVAVRAWRALGCRDAGKVDIRYDVWSKPFFVEANPIAGLRPGESDFVVLAEHSGFSFDSLIGLILDEATGRVKG